MKTNEWTTYRTRFLVKAKQLQYSLSFTDALGRQHAGRKGDYLVESSDGVLRIHPRQIFEDVYVPMLVDCVATGASAGESTAARKEKESVGTGSRKESLGTGPCKQNVGTAACKESVGTGPGKESVGTAACKQSVGTAASAACPELSRRVQPSAARRPATRPEWKTGALAPCSDRQSSGPRIGPYQVPSSAVQNARARTAGFGS